jgi:uncharacterized membrane protein
LRGLFGLFRLLRIFFVVVFFIVLLFIVIVIGRVQMRIRLE